MSVEAVTQLKMRLREDLLTAMRKRAADEVVVLRTLLAEIDNAEAVPVGRLHDRYAVKGFGDPSVEAPRKQLSSGDLQNLLRREKSDRLQAAADLEAAGRAAQASKLRHEADVVQRYILD